MAHVKRLLTIVVAGIGIALLGAGCATTEGHGPSDEHPSAPSGDEHPNSEHPG